MCLDFLYIFCETFGILKRIQQGIIMNVHVSLCTVSDILAIF